MTDRRTDRTESVIAIASTVLCIASYADTHGNSNGKSGVYDFRDVNKSATVTDTQKWNYICFGANLALSGRPSLLQSFADTFTEPVLVANPEFVVGISMLSAI